MTTASHIMVVDDDPDVLLALAQNLTLAGYEVVTANSAETALRAITRGYPGIILSDIRMPGLDGLELLRRVVGIDPELPVVLMSAHADVTMAMQAVRDGAYDFITKPFDPPLLQAALRRAVDWRRVVLANRGLHSARELATRSELVSASPAMQRVIDQVRTIAQTDLPCLIAGEPGTGASTVARLLHRLSARSGAALVVVDCLGAALPGAESQMFGHSSGAFAGATMPRTGDIERANRGTLVLDRVDGLPAALQARMGRLLEDGKLVPLGSDVARTLDLRFIAISHRADGVAGSPSMDTSLLYKLRATRIDLPPLRERREDIEPLFRQFFAAALATARAGSALPVLGPAIWTRLARHDWPGNLVELEAFARSAADGMADQAGPDEAGQHRVGTPSLRSRMAQHEAAILRQTLEEVCGDIRLATERLELPRKTLYERLARHGIIAADYRA